MATYGMDPSDVAGPLPDLIRPEDEENADALQTPQFVTPAQAAEPPVGVPTPSLAPTPQGDELAPPGPELAPTPTAPGPTGDPKVDVQNDIDYHRKLTAYEGEVDQHKTDLAKIAAQAKIKQADKEKALQDQETAAAQVAAESRAKDRAERTSAMEARKLAHQEAEKDLTKGYFEGKGTGDRVWAALMIALGSIGQGLQNAGAAKIGQVGQARNQGLIALDQMMEDDYRRKQAKVAAAKEDVLEARYGMQDMEANHRAAQNDNDALFAARWKTIAQETKAELERRGMSAAEIQSNETYLHALQKESEYDEKIHSRQEEMAEREREAKAREANQRAMLNKQLAAHGKGADLAERRLALQYRRLATNEAKTWADKEGLYKIKKGQEELRASMRLLDEHPTDPAIQQQVLDKMIIAARGGGTVTQGAYAQFGSHLGGLKGKFQDRLESGDTGGWGDTTKANFKEALKATYAELQRLGSEKYEEFKEGFSDSPYYADLEKRHFAGMSGYGGNEEGIPARGKTKAEVPAPAAPAAPKAAAPATPQTIPISGHGKGHYELGADGNYHLVKG